jgi:hypothetical protein
LQYWEVLGKYSGEYVVGTMQSRSFKHAVVAMAAALATLSALPAGAAGQGEDTTAPYIAWVTSSLSTDAWKLHSAWAGEDADSGPDMSAARFRVKELGGAWSRWRHPEEWRDMSPSASIPKYIRRGHRYEFQARITDVAGNMSAWESVGGAKRPRA